MTLNIFHSLLLIIIALLLTSCVFNIRDFSEDELKWFEPYNKTDTIIYSSEKGELDSIIFQKAIATRASTRGFEQGFYNTNYLTVPYSFTGGSYHQFAFMSGGKKRYEQDIFNISKSSSMGSDDFEIIFIGTIFNGKELDNIQKINEHTFYFSSNNATYSGVNVEKEINDFTFDTKIGITKYTDSRGLKWERK